MVEEFKNCGNGCDENGFIINSDGSSSICICREKYKQRITIRNKLLECNLIDSDTSINGIDKIISYNIDTDYCGKDIYKNNSKLKKYIRDFDKTFNSISLYFYGKQGTQKTTVAKYIGLELIKLNKTVYYIQTKDFISLIMDSERDEDKRNILEYIIRVDCLILDEFEDSKLALFASGYKQSVLTSPLKTRLENIQKSTIFISNSSVENMKKSSLGETIGDLVSRETRLGVFTFEDYYGDYMKNIDLSDLWGDD